MIIRTGLVSNSSSTAFLVSGDDHESTIALAEAMINCRMNEPPSNEIFIQNMHTKLSKNKLKNPNVMFPTCNYDTWIAWLERSNMYAVSTCNNESWNDIPTIYTSCCNNIKELIDAGINNSEDLECKIPHLYWYWDILNDIMIKQVDWENDKYEYNHCKIHYNSNCLIQGTNELLCPTCYAENNPKLTLSKVKLRLQQGLRSPIFNLRK